ncbi:hypothetical protein FGG08_002110 [Glutinoglossum americanum]|uniref:MARVEL domain-containing protein n=1 Tax=Glutinoglossum americanum TaxID=1670608 RepID=A0A9P8I9T5_9PEZI|nr:hypothetical protein FGG08_002110 [Glutinoglossum americanum]
MPAPKFGALGMAFVVTRGLQIASLIAIIGLTANFISDMVSKSVTPPNVLVGTLSVTCIATIYCFITYILYHDNILPFLVNTGVDSLLLIAVIVVAVTVGKPLSYLNCQVISAGLNRSASSYTFTASIGSNLNKVAVSDGKANYALWMGTAKSTCLEMKSIWGLSIALCILFSFSAVSSALLWRRAKAVPKTIDDA